MPSGQTRRPRKPRRSGRGVGARVDQRTRAARADGREARDELLAAALRVFALRGYREAGVDEIAAEAGYSKGALYWHFSSKEALLVALVEERIDTPIRDPELRTAYAKRQAELRGALAAGLEARARHLGAPAIPMPADEVARIVMSIIGGLAIDELIEPDSVRPELLADALA